jgi:hypothetical protein
MKPATLESFSVEILDAIFSYVDHTHKTTLKAIVLVNHRFHSLASPFLFSTLRLYIQDEGVVSSVVQTLPRRVIQHARHLFIEGLTRQELFPSHHLNYHDMRDSFFHSDRRNWEALEYGRGGPFLAGLAEDAQCKPLAASIAQMPVLKDLTYNYACQLAPCILEAIHQFRPQCRLHINTFLLRCLNEPDQFHPFLDLENHELALATSPCLHSIAIALRPQPDYNGNAIKELAAGLAPNLKRIHSFTAPLFAQIGEEFTDKLPWQGFRIASQKGSAKAQTPPHRSLCSLLLEYGDAEDWQAFTSLSNLRCFELDSYSPRQFNYLATCSFASLQTLILNLGHPHSAYKASSMILTYQQETSSCRSRHSGLSN